jgi:hypothetical protein
MVIVKNFNTSIMWKAESVYGTGVQPDTAVGRVNTANFNLNNNPIKVRNAGSGRNVNATLYGPFDASFSWDAELHDFDIFKLIVGPKAGSGTAGSHYTYTESNVVATSGIPFVTIEKGSNDTTDEDSTMVGCVVDTCTINFVVGATAKYTMSGVGRTTTADTTAATYTEPSTLPWVFHQITVAWGATPTAIGRVNNGSITINNNLVKYRECGDRFIKQPEPGVRDYLFSLNVIMSETSYQTLRTSFYGASGAPVTGVTSAAFVTTDELKLTFSEGTASGNRNATVWLDECVIDNMSEPVNNGSGLVQVTFNGHAHLGKGNIPIEQWTT